MSEGFEHDVKEHVAELYGIQVGNYSNQAPIQFSLKLYSRDVYIFATTLFEALSFLNIYIAVAVYANDLPKGQFLG